MWLASARVLVEAKRHGLIGSVSETINGIRIFLQARPEDFDKIRPLIENVIKPPTMLLGDSLYYLLEYLEKCLLIDPRSSFGILEELLNNIGENFYNQQDYIRVSHSKAPLSILNTIFECLWDVEDRALQVLDRLIELNWAGVDEYLKASDRL